MTCAPDNAGKKCSTAASRRTHRPSATDLTSGWSILMTLFRSARSVSGIVLGALLAVSGALAADAQEYPNQPIKLVVPFVAGGGFDVVARIIAPKLGEALVRSVIIENKGGAGGMLGALTVAQSPPDGYTILFGTGSTH